MKTHKRNSRSAVHWIARPECDSGETWPERYGCGVTLRQVQERSGGATAEVGRVSCEECLAKIPLTEAEWGRVFAARCKSKRGEAITEDERALVDRAYVADYDRYASLDADVFDATVPFGSSARWRR